MKKLASILFLLIYNLSIAQTNNNSSCQIPIELEDFNIYITGGNGDIGRKLISMDSLHITLTDCAGEMKIKVFDPKGRLKTEGSYVNSLDTLKKYVNKVDPLNDTEVIAVIEYFKPLKDGVWKYYNVKSGRLTKTEIFKRGILLSKVQGINATEYMLENYHRPIVTNIFGNQVLKDVDTTTVKYLGTYSKEGKIYS